MKSSLCSSVGDCIDVQWDDDNTIALFNVNYDKLVVTQDEFDAFIRGVKKGDFDSFLGVWTDKEEETHRNDANRVPRRS